MSHLHRQDLDLLHHNLLAGKLPRSLSWADSVALIEYLGKVEPHGKEDFAFTVAGHRAFFKKPHAHEFGLDGIAHLRGFLRAARPPKGSSPAVHSGRMVVVIDHHGARLFRDLDQGTMKETGTVRPYDPFGFHHHLIHKKEAHYKGEHVPEETSFYEAIAKDLIPAVEIVLVGHGTGKSSAVDFLAAYLQSHHPETAKKIVASETADLSALTEPEIVQLAMKHLAAAEA